jgi:3D (Asp-Asp-Asp) domain-containing protein
MRIFPRIILLSAVALLGVGCATQMQTATTAPTKRICKVRTTAYTCTETGGRRNAVGSRLSSKNVKSAAADWSRWPLGTKFRIVGTDEVFQVDDYGSALIGTGTIDLYKTNRLAMNKWGVRRVDIDVIEWGSPERSLEVLGPRAQNPKVRAMILALSKKPGTENPIRF